MKKTGSILLLAVALLITFKGGQLAQFAKSSAKQIVATQTSAARHTADANAVIDWASE